MLYQLSYSRPEAKTSRISAAVARIALPGTPPLRMMRLIPTARVLPKLDNKGSDGKETMNLDSSKDLFGSLITLAALFIAVAVTLWVNGLTSNEKKLLVIGGFVLFVILGVIAVEKSHRRIRENRHTD